MNNYYLNVNNHPLFSYQRVLMVEDDLRIVDFVQRGLKAEGYTVEVANNGLDAIQLATANPYHLILLDLGLPDITGSDVCARLRESGNLTPILMLTARDALQDKVAGLRMGADDYLTKPFAFEELLARSQALIRRTPVENKPVSQELCLADLVLNLETHQVKRGNHSIELTAKEFALLECFLRKPGKMLNRSQILDQVWGNDADPLTNVVDVYIHQLRRKIDDDHPIKLLKTVRGYGYKMDQT